jgi:hypothetical protein
MRQSGCKPDGFLKLLSGKQAEVNYGQNHCVLRAQSLPEKDISAEQNGKVIEFSSARKKSA